jgi:hypothetical protein
MLSQKEIGELESKLERAQSILKAIWPDLDVNSPNLQAEILGKLHVPTNDDLAPVPKLEDTSSMQEYVSLETVLEETGQLKLDGQGNWSYHGHGSAEHFHRRIAERFGDVAGKGLDKNTLLTLRSISSIEESPRTLEDQFFEQAQDSIVLPPKDVALELISSALGEGCALLKFVHEPSFYSMFHQIYLIDPENYSFEENKFLPLLYATFAVGYLFSNSERTKFGYTHAISQGFVNALPASRYLLRSQFANRLLR